MLAKTTQFSPFCLVDVDEALGLTQALKWVADLGFDSTNFSLDSKIVVNDFNGDNNNNNEFDNIIHHCRQLFSTSFNNSKVEFSWSQTNWVAHELTQTTPL